MRFTQQVDLAAGDYLFTTTSDDGVRVKVDGDLVINKWVNQGSTTWTGVASLAAGIGEEIISYHLDLLSRDDLEELSARTW